MTSKSTYRDAYYEGININPQSALMCEMCAILNQVRQRAVDIHHIVPKSLGGEDVYKNLIAVCREHHNQCHNKTFSEKEVKKIHKTFGDSLYLYYF